MLFRGSLAGPTLRIRLALCLLGSAWLTAATGLAQDAADTQPATAPAAPTVVAVATQPAAQEAELKPRCELFTPSVARLLAEAKRSHSGAFLDPLAQILLAAGESASEAPDVGSVLAMLQQIQSWPDTSVGFAVFAPDREGRARWLVRLEWPLEDLRTRVRDLMAGEAGAELLAGVAFEEQSDGSCALRLPETPLAYLQAAGDRGSVIASHADLPIKEATYRGPVEVVDQLPPLLSCRRSFGQTEKDSGATFLSSVRFVTSVEYAGAVDEQGAWRETVRASWPPISGTVAKALLGRVKQTFFVPQTAHGAVVVNAGMLKGALDGLVGLGPQAAIGAGGEVTIMGAEALGPLATHADSEMCFIALPGSGFFPVPDVIAQCKVNKPEGLLRDLRKATEQVNQAFREQEQPEPWHEAEVGEQTVFWHDSSGRSGGAMLPFATRTVLFTHAERDDDGRERDFLIVGWTSTAPEALVERWCALPRASSRLFMPRQRKLDGEVWVNTRALYTWLEPYMNVGLSVASAGALLPDADALGEKLSDAWIQARMRYTGLDVSVEAPLPAGLVAVPLMLGTALQTDWSGGSDLARERLACQRLRVLYHHAKLFRQDIGRWPAAVAELDGYVDFAGNPGLLLLRRSAAAERSEGWGDVFKGMLGSGEATQTDEESAGDSEIDDSLYTIDWGQTTWTLGFKPQTFEHLEKLYIDQDGTIHRVEKHGSSAVKDEAGQTNAL